MNRHNLLDKKYIVRVLGLILTSDGGKISNIGLTKKLNKNPSTIYEQLSYLENQGIITKERIKDSTRNEKEYSVSSNKLTELFLGFLEKEENIKNLLKFKDNSGIHLTLDAVISAKTINSLQKSKDITLKHVFYDAYVLFLKTSLLKEISKTYTFYIKAEEKEFKRFLEIMRIRALSLQESIRKEKSLQNQVLKNIQKNQKKAKSKTPNPITKNI